MLILAQIHIHARRESAAQNIVHRLNGDLVRIGFGRRHVSGED